jgi:hypothetical protein
VVLGDDPLFQGQMLRETPTRRKRERFEDQ